MPLKIYILIVIFLCHLLSVTYESDLYGNIFSPIVAFYSSYVIYSSVKKFQLLTDITGIGIILMILIWSFIFSKTSMRYESSFDFINTTVYMLSDFLVLASYIVFYFSARKKKTPISFNTVFWGILIYTFTDFYYAYLDLIGMYNANTLIDSSYTLTCTLFAIGSYFRSIRPIRLASSTQTPYEALPYNYGNSKKFQTKMGLLDYITEDIF